MLTVPDKVTAEELDTDRIRIYNSLTPAKQLEDEGIEQEQRRLEEERERLQRELEEAERKREEEGGGREETIGCA